MELRNSGIFNPKKIIICKEQKITYATPLHEHPNKPNANTSLQPNNIDLTLFEAIYEE